MTSGFDVEPDDLTAHASHVEGLIDVILKQVRRRERDPQAVRIIVRYVGGFVPG